METYTVGIDNRVGGTTVLHGLTVEQVREVQTSRTLIKWIHEEDSEW